MPTLNASVLPDFSKDKYFQILKRDGLSEALTVLHKDLEQWEFEAFEGKHGYNPQLVQYLNEVRGFSRELWRSSLDQSVPNMN